MNRLFLVVLFINCFFAHAELAQDEYEIYDTCINETIRLGDRFSNILQMYPNIVFRGLKKYSNITHKQFEYNGISFSISAYVKAEADAPVLDIEIKNNRFKTKRGIKIGNTREDVIQKYGSEDHNWNNNLYYFNREYDWYLANAQGDGKGWRFLYQL